MEQFIHCHEGISLMVRIVAKKKKRKLSPFHDCVWKFFFKCCVLIVEACLYSFCKVLWCFPSSSLIVRMHCVLSFIELLFPIYQVSKCISVG